MSIFDKRVLDVIDIAISILKDNRGGYSCHALEDAIHLAGGLINSYEVMEYYVLFIARKHKCRVQECVLNVAGIDLHYDDYKKFPFWWNSQARHLEARTAALASYKQWITEMQARNDLPEELL